MYLNLYLYVIYKILINYMRDIHYQICFFSKFKSFEINISIVQEPKQTNNKITKKN